jgi:hypothetical protein
MSDSEEEVDEATAFAYQLLEAEFEELCRRLKQHDARSVGTSLLRLMLDEAADL